MLNNVVFMMIFGFFAGFLRVFIDIYQFTDGFFLCLLTKPADLMANPQVWGALTNRVRP
jgi:hypothetical protein